MMETSNIRIIHNYWYHKSHESLRNTLALKHLLLRFCFPESNWCFSGGGGRFSGTNFWWSNCPNRLQNEADRAETREKHHFSALRGKRGAQNRFVPENLSGTKFSGTFFPPHRSEIGSEKNNNDIVIRLYLSVSVHCNPLPTYPSAPAGVCIVDSTHWFLGAASGSPRSYCVPAWPGCSWLTGGWYNILFFRRRCPGSVFSFHFSSREFFYAFGENFEYFWLQSTSKHSWKLLRFQALAIADFR